MEAPPGALAGELVRWPYRTGSHASLGGATEWLNSEPLGPAELRGQVVLFNFWTLTCINWLRQEPYVRAWSQAYRDDGLVVIGVHTPEFSFELDRREHRVPIPCAGHASRPVSGKTGAIPFLLDGEVPGPLTASTFDDGNGVLGDDRLYQPVRQGDHKGTLDSLSASPAPRRTHSRSARNAG